MRCEVADISTQALLGEAVTKEYQHNDWGLPERGQVGSELNICRQY